MGREIRQEGLSRSPRIFPLSEKAASRDHPAIIRPRGPPRDHPSSWPAFRSGYLHLAQIIVASRLQHLLEGPTGNLAGSGLIIINVLRYTIKKQIKALSAIWLQGE